MASAADYWQSRYEKAAIERDRFRDHSVLLNSVGWKISEALDRVGPGETATEGDVLADLETLIEDRNKWRIQALEFGVN